MAKSSQQLDSTKNPQCLAQDSVYYTDQEFRDLQALTHSTAVDKFEQLDAYLENHAEVILKKDKEGRTMVHWAATAKTPEMLNLVHKHLAKRKLEEYLLVKDNLGNTPLHYCAQYGTVEVAETLLAKLTPAKQQQAATTLNDFGTNPIDIPLINRTSEELPAMYHTLRDAGSENQTGILPLGMMVDEKEVLARYPECKHNPELQENLVIACKITNIARKIVKISSSHPERNSLTEEDRWLVTKHVKELQEFIRKTSEKICEEFEEANNEFHFKINILAYRAVKAYQAANCDEFADVCMALLFLENPYKGGCICRVKNGNHIFMKIGNDPKSSVYCDAWSGQIFRESDAAQKLRWWKEYPISEGVYVNITGPINEKHNGIIEERKVDPITKTPDFEEEWQKLNESDSEEENQDTTPEEGSTSSQDDSDDSATKKSRKRKFEETPPSKSGLFKRRKMNHAQNDDQLHQMNKGSPTR